MLTIWIFKIHPVAWRRASYWGVCWMHFEKIARTIMAYTISNNSVTNKLAMYAHCYAVVVLSFAGSNEEN